MITKAKRILSGFCSNVCNDRIVVVIKKIKKLLPLRAFKQFTDAHEIRIECDLLSMSMQIRDN
jgi:hypothetical protein